MFPKGLSPVATWKRGPDDVPAIPSSRSPAGDGLEMLASAALVVSTVFQP